MKRQLILSKFRNLGFDKDDYFVINNSLEKGKMGDLVTIIGQNNAGKSNVLDALLKVSTGSLDERDITDLSYEDKDRTPVLTYEIKDKGLCVKKIVSLNGASTYKYDIDDLDKGFTEKDLIAYIKDLQSVAVQYNLTDSYLTDIFNQVTSGNYKGDFDALTYGTKEVLKKITNNGKLSRLNSYDEKLNKSTIPELLLNEFNIIKFLVAKYGYNPFARIFRYEQKNITSNFLTINNLTQINNHPFFDPLLKKLDISESMLKAAYNDYAKSHNIQVLKKLNKQIEKKMSDINETFNRLYFAGNDKYHFSLECGVGGVSFGMGRGENEDPINIEYQSVGFKWFFDLFFSYVLNKQLEPGSVIVMDEPAHNLHPEGQRELHKFLKEFAKANDITFVIATHSPFIIDVDYYDELRVVSMADNKSHIDNLFSAINENDPDSLLPIKKALTIQQNVFYDFDTRVYWVEGISDYNYLTLFKKLLKKDKIAFIPFNGVGNTKESTHNILVKIAKIPFYNFGMLVDADKAGNDMYSQAQQTKFKDRVVRLSELNTDAKRYMTIEDLFSKKDIEKHPGLDYKKEDEYKKAYLSSCMKRNCSLNDFDKETIENFKELFALLEE